MSGSPRKLVLEIVLGEAIPSFKNHKRMGLTKSGNPMSFTRKDIKQRMQLLEEAIAFALYSEFQAASAAMDSEWQKQLQTLSSGLSDDSLNQIPEFSFAVEYVQPGMEGVRIEIEEL